MITSKSLGILNTVWGGFFFLVGIRIIADPFHYLYLSPYLCLEILESTLCTWEVIGGAILIAIGVWMLFKGIKRLRK